MTTFRYRDEDDTSGGLLFLAAGALAGLAAGMFIAQRFGGVGTITERLRERFGGLAAGLVADEDALFEDGELPDDELDDASPDETLEERVLEAFHHDPILSERAVDIGAIGEGIIELAGWVHTDDESAHAVTLTRGVPGVVTVVNRLDVRADEEELTSTARKYASGDPALTESGWEGQAVGTGRSRQGSSAEFDRNIDPKPGLEAKWMDEAHALRSAAEDTTGIAERRAKAKKPKGDRTGGAPIAPTGVPKADHVADPAAAQDLNRGETGRSGDTTRRAD